MSLCVGYHYRWDSDALRLTRRTRDEDSRNSFTLTLALVHLVLDRILKCSSGTVLIVLALALSERLELLAQRVSQVRQVLRLPQAEWQICHSRLFVNMFTFIPSGHA